MNENDTVSAEILPGSSLVDQNCRICGGGFCRSFVGHERMFGAGDAFTYLECADCGCVQIAEYPADIGRFYPDNYLPYTNGPGESAPRGMMGALKIRALECLFTLSPYLWRRWLQSKWLQEYLSDQPIKKLYLKLLDRNSVSILDVGCAKGDLLRGLSELYFTNLSGIDLFVGSDIVHNGKVLVRKMAIYDVVDKYQCISLHHVLEHMPHQHDVMRKIHQTLTDDGVAIIRIPIVGGLAWRKYQEFWVGLDAPRHFYLHTEASFQLLAERAGFDVVSIEYDSFSEQFLGSEAYLRGVSLSQIRQFPKGFGEIFDADEIIAYQSQAEALNKSRDGDQIIAILRKK